MDKRWASVGAFSLNLEVDLNDLFDSNIITTITIHNIFIYIIILNTNNHC